jgi:hypothetical protein
VVEYSGVDNLGGLVASVAMSGLLAMSVWWRRAGDINGLLDGVCGA